MRTKLRWILPTFQVVLAGALLVSNFFRPDRMESPAWTKADRQFCDALNAPAALIRFCILKISDKWLPNHSTGDFVIETLGYLVLVGLLWYLVGREIVRNYELKCRVLPTDMRRVIDCVLVLFGTALLGFGVLVRRQFGFPIGLYAQLISLPYFIWGMVLVLFYGYELWMSLSRSSESQSRGM